MMALAWQEEWKVVKNIPESSTDRHPQRILGVSVRSDPSPIKDYFGFINGPRAYLTTNFIVTCPLSG